MPNFILLPSHNFRKNGYKEYIKCLTLKETTEFRLKSMVHCKKKTIRGVITCAKYVEISIVSRLYYQYLYQVVFSKRCKLCCNVLDSLIAKYHRYISY